MLVATTHGALLAVAIGAGAPSFEDATGPAGLTFTHDTTADKGSVFNQKFRMTPGVGVGDFDRDGSLDLFVQGGTSQNARLFMNDGTGQFTDQAIAWGVDLTAVEGASVTVADLDGDGHLDVYAGTINTRNYLYINTGVGAFIETGAACGAADLAGVPFDTFGTAAGDVDQDGDLDLVTVEWRLSTSTGNRLFTGNGDGTFVEQTAAAGVFTGPDALEWGFTTTIVDMNGDRVPDLPVAADFGTSQYYANLGGGVFQRIIDNGACTDENGMGAAIGDYDNDGDPDWFVTSIYDDDGTIEGGWGTSGNRLYRNDGMHSFGDATDLAGVRDGDWGWGASFGDLDHDGLLDLAMTNGFFMPYGGNPDPTFETDPARLWMNSGDFTVGPTFVEVAAAAGLDHTASGKGLVMFDADLDGDLDIVITTNRGDLAYYRNTTNPAATTWLQVDVISPDGNPPDGIGAHVELTVAGTTYHRWVHGSPSFMSQDPLRVHFGFPATATVDAAVIRWPDGTSSVWTDLTPGRVVRLRVEDIDADGRVGFSDLTALILRWGSCAGTCVADIDRDGGVGFSDLTSLLASWE